MNRRLVGRNNNQINRAVRMAFNDMKAKIPKDTGTLRGSLQLRQTSNGFTMFFQQDNVNPKSKRKVREYINYVERYHNEWWENAVHTFFSELSSQTGRPVKKK